VDHGDHRSARLAFQGSSVRGTLARGAASRQEEGHAVGSTLGGPGTFPNAVDLGRDLLPWLRMVGAKICTLGWLVLGRKTGWSIAETGSAGRESESSLQMVSIR
jgi:hypothetical protein